MGSPIGPSFANIFMSNLENEFIKDKLNEFGILKYCRYVDDTFIIARSQDSINKFFDYVNTLHPQIKFTKEAESQNSLPFLDILICKQYENNITKFNTSTYHKPTFSGVYSKFNSFMSQKYLANLIYLF